MPLFSELDDVQIGVARQRGDEYAPWRATWLQNAEGVLLALHNLESVRDGAQITADVFLSPDAADRVADVLRAHAAQVRLDAVGGAQ